MKNITQFLIIFALTAAAFVAGTFWKINQAVSPAPVEKKEKKTVQQATITEEVAAPKRANLPVRGLNSAEKATIALFEKASPSVVFITTSDVRRDYFTMTLNEYKSGSGSGFIWDYNGHIITNYHVVGNADKITVTLSDQNSYPAELVGIAPSKDLAVLKIDAPESQLNPVKTGKSYNLKVGQSVYAIGNPFGLDQTLTTGVVSALGREINSLANIPIKDVIQTDAAINPGNSGGPLLNSSGELIGVNTAIYSPSGASAGIGFSIPVDAVNWVVPDLIKYGKLQRPTLGIGLYPNQETTRRMGLDGVLVFRVTEGGAAEKAGIQPTYRDRNGRLHLGDIIKRIDDQVISTQNDLLLALEKYKVGDLVQVAIERGEDELVVEVKLDPSN
jgi:S1-C subfamily serine protease